MKKASIHQNSRRVTDLVRRNGFTLIELLVVIAIVILLASIVAPAINNAKTFARKRASQIMLNNIDQGVQLYRQDFDNEPPPATDTNLPAYSGAELLCFYLIGYAPDLGLDHATNPNSKPDGLALSSPDFYTDDGCDAYGFRDPDDHRGPKRGPYNDLQDVDREMKPNWVFIDSFGDTIEYATFVSGTSTFTDSTPIPITDIKEYAKDDSGNFFRKDYILMSKGKNYKFVAYQDDQQSDDITNFFPK